MTTFSATEAAFEGFRLVRRHPMIVVWWSLAYFILFVVGFAVFGDAMASLMAISESVEGAAEPSIDDLRRLGEAMAGLFAVALPLGLLSSVVLNAAVARGVLSPEARRFGYLRLGMDEVRVLVVTLALVAIQAVASIIGFGVVGGLIGAAEATGQAWLVLIGVLLALAVIAGLIFLMVRLSLTVPITIAERRIAILDSWRMTAPAFWPLFGMAVLAFVMTMVVSLLSSIVVMPVSLATGGLADLAAYDGQSAVAILTAAWPAVLAWCVFNAFASSLQLAVMYAPFSAAYRGLKGLPPA